jgi:hypothetical protein
LFFVEDDMADAVKKEEAAAKTVPTYLIENVVRKQGTRLHRARATTRHRFKQYIAGQRLIRSKKLPLSEEAFQKEEAKIVELLQAGIVAVHTPDNIRITTLPDGRYVLTKMPNRGTKILDHGELPSCFKGGTAKAEVPKKAPPKVEATKEERPEATGKTEPDDLTELPNIGGGRARKLTASGITSFAQIASMDPDQLASTLGVDEGMAAEVIEAAKGR